MHLVKALAAEGVGSLLRRHRLQGAQLRQGVLHTGFDGLQQGDGVFLGCFLVGSSRVDLQACKLEYSIVSPK